MSRCAGCGHEHGLLEGWCEECIANGKRDEAMLAPAKLPLDDEHALPKVGHVYEDAQGRRLKVERLDIGSPDGREVLGAIEVKVSVGTPRPCCSEADCHKPAVTRGLCRKCYSRWHRAANPEMYVRANAVRRPARKCACGAPVGKWARYCAACRSAATKRRATERQKNMETQRQIERMRAAAKPGYGKTPAIKGHVQIANQIGASDDRASVALLQAIAGDPCAYCGGPCEAIDHIEPVSTGGERSIANVTAACQPCNSRKHARTLLSFLLTERIDEELEPLAAERRAAWGLAA